jgi:hypothetical protein
MDDELGEVRHDHCHMLEVTEVDGQLLGRCGCGWTATPAATGRDLGERWAAHRRRLAGVARVA